MNQSSSLFKLADLFCLLLLCTLIAFIHHSSSSSMQQRCHDDERSALLNFKKSIIISDGCDPSVQSKLESWKLLQGEKGDCCLWDGVECDEKTNHVIGLDLSSTCLYGSINSNNSLFSLVHLQRLNLAHNDFTLSQIPSQVGLLSRLTHLDLSSSNFFGQIPSEMSNLSNLVSLDLSENSDLKLHKLGMKGLVQNLTNLKELHLSGVGISSTVPDILANILPLESLQLAECGLQGEFPMAIFQLPNLKMLDINGNSDLKGYFPDVQWESRLKSLSFSGTKFRGELPSSIGNLANLEELDISYCSFSGQLPSSLGNLTNLAVLDLSNNKFWVQRISFSWLNKLTKLNTLSLYGINSNGNTNISSQLMNLTQLYYLDLGYCELIGPIPSSLMNLTELAYIYLDHNQLIGEIPSWLIYRNNIQILFLSSNHLSGQIPSVNNNSLSQLIHLDLSVNKLQGPIPSSLSKLENLLLLELHSNRLVGEVDFHMFLQLSKLRALTLSFNNLFLLTKINVNVRIQNFKFLGLASCNISEFPSFLHNQNQLQFLDLSRNNIHGQIPSWVWNISTNSLSFMNLSHNFLTGFEQNPQPIVLQWAHLSVLDLRSNMLQGSISFSSRLRNGCKLKMINLSQNQIQGQVPRSLANCTDLELLDLSNNQFNDSFPYWLGSLPELRVLILRSNVFYGAMEKHENCNFSKLQIIDLSHNHLTGKLPSVYFEIWEAMKVRDASHMSYIGKNQEFSVSNYYSTYDYSMTINNKGLETKYLKIPDTLAAIDFSHNKFEGEIPNLIGNLIGLHLFNISNNNLSGEIPSSLMNLKELECLDLSVNKFSEEIPPQLTELTFLSSFNVGYNQLVGPIPQGNQFDTFEDKSFEGNLGLCGAPLKKKCGNVEASSPPPSSLFAKDHGLRSSIFEFGWKIVLLGYGSGFVIGGVVGYIFTTRKNGWYVRIFGRNQPRRRQRRTRNRNRIDN